MQQLKDIIYLFDTSNLYLEFKYNKRVARAKGTTEKIITCDYYIVPFNKEFVRFNNSIKSYDTIKNLRAELEQIIVMNWQTFVLDLVMQLGFL